MEKWEWKKKILYSRYFEIYILIHKDFYKIKYIFHKQCVLKEQFNFPKQSPPHCLIDSELKEKFIEEKLNDEMINKLEEIKGAQND